MGVAKAELARMMERFYDPKEDDDPLEDSFESASGEDELSDDPGYEQGYMGDDEKTEPAENSFDGINFEDGWKTSPAPVDVDFDEPAPSAARTESKPLGHDGRRGTQK